MKQSQYYKRNLAKKNKNSQAIKQGRQIKQPHENYNQKSNENES